MNFYKQAATAIDHLDTKQGSVKGSIAAAGLGDGANGKEGKRVLACTPCLLVSMLYVSDSHAVLHIYVLVVIESLKCKTFPPAGSLQKQTVSILRNRPHNHPVPRRLSQTATGREKDLSTKGTRWGAFIKEPLACPASRLALQQRCQDPGERQMAAKASYHAACDEAES